MNDRIEYVHLENVYVVGSYRLEYDRSIGFARVWWKMKNGSEVHCGFFLRKCKGKWIYQSFLSEESFEQIVHKDVYPTLKNFLDRGDDGILIQSRFGRIDS